ncbi:MAG TPA: wax ester/triacylglycerol synthase family O-acyltransferase [Thermoanaerobaculia bacterium]|nr:wax ester/triacylglycerol synthase family O-acyltransferase [Thermoanaerobaculia bacterium]
MSTLEAPAAPPPRPRPALAESEPLSAVDHAWLRMDEPANLMQINGVLVLDEPLPLERVKSIVRRRLLPIARFRQRVAAEGGGHPSWEEDPELDLDRHVLEQRLPEPGDDEALSAVVGELMSAPLEPRRPLWEFRLLQNYRGGCALFARIHHAIGDGVALMLVLLSLTDTEPSGPAAVEPQPDEAERPEPPEEQGRNPFTELFCHPGRDLARVRALAEEIMPDGLRLLLQPVEALRRARLATGVGSVGSFGRLLARPADPKTPFKGPLGVPKLAAWSERLALAEVKEVGKALGGTVNDVLLSATAGGLRRYLLRQGEPPRSLNIRAAMPVNLRPFGKMHELGNHFGLIFLSLPLGIRDPLARLAEVRRLTRALKRSTEPVVVYGILRALGRVPLAIQRQVVKIFATKATAVMTNVPGPRQILYLAGKPVRDIFFWVPQSGHVGLGVSICSYNGAVRLGVGTDAGLIPDPRAIVEGFHAEFAELLGLARRSPAEPSGAEPS